MKSQASYCLRVGPRMFHGFAVVLVQGQQPEQIMRRGTQEFPMKSVIRFVASSIGKKSIMALSGGLLSLFLLVHTAGNFTMFFGRDPFNSYAAHLHSLGFILYFVEAGLFLLFLIHITVATLLFLENLKARPVRYHVSKTGGGRTPGSGTMPYTGLFILLFLMVHISDFQAAGFARPSEAVRQILSRPPYAFFYAAAITALALHLSHGCWSMFQSLGINHPNYNRLLRLSALIFSLGVGTILILIPALAVFYDQFLL